MTRARVALTSAAVIGMDRGAGVPPFLGGIKAHDHSGRGEKFIAQRNLSSRPEFACAVGPPKEMKNGSHAATALHGRATLHLVIPSEAEGPAVQRTFRGNVFRQSAPGFPVTWY